MQADTRTREPRRRSRVVLRWVLFAGVAGVLLLNVVAYMHARAMTHFSEDGLRTASPEDLTRWQRLETLLSGVDLPRPRNTRTPKALGLPFETVTFETVDGLRLEGWWIDAGGSEAVILFHGYSASKQSLLAEARVFVELGCSALLVDFRGSGGSEGASTSLGWHEAHDVAAAVDFVQRRHAPRRLVLHGASMGAVAVLRALSLQRLDVDGAILEGPFNDLLDTTSNRFRRMGLPAFPFARLLLFWGGRQQAFDPFAHRPVDYIQGVETPTLLMFGRLDPRVTVADAEALIERGGLNVRTVWFEDAGHPHLLRQARDPWVREVEAFLDRLRAAAGE